MKCPYCQSAKLSVLDSRNTIDNIAIRRRRECEDCKKRFTTFERIEELDILVIKKDSTKIPFSFDKVLGGIAKACQKLPVSNEEHRKMAEAVTAYVRSRPSNEITSREIGDQVMKQLRKVNKVAYIRFASIYKEFKDVDEFEDELKKLGRK
jgi:transcriptional repressor NrdR